MLILPINKNNMRQLLFILCFSILAFSCGNADKKVKGPFTKDSTAAITIDTDMQRPVAPPAITDSTKTVKLTFSGYEEGDYAHLLFTEPATGKEYDFGHPDDNTLNGIQVVIKNDKTSFGYKENRKMKGAKFIADLVYKMTDTYDDNGQPIKGKEWRIISLRKDE